jgi:hypothetical protein
MYQLAACTRLLHVPGCCIYQLAECTRLLHVACLHMTVACLSITGTCLGKFAAGCMRWEFICRYAREETAAAPQRPVSEAVKEEDAEQGDSPSKRRKLNPEPELGGEEDEDEVRVEFSAVQGTSGLVLQSNTFHGKPVLKGSTCEVPCCRAQCFVPSHLLSPGPNYEQVSS